MNKRSAMSAMLSRLLDQARRACGARAPAVLRIDAPGLELELASPSSAAGRPFRIASLTKPFTAAAVHRLIELRRLTLATTLSEVASATSLARLDDGGYDPTRISIGHLLSHTSGLFDHTTAPEYATMVQAEPGRLWTRDEQLALAVTHGRLRGSAGETYSYSDTGYILLGEIIEQVAQQNLAAAVRKLLGIDALGLEATWWEALEPAQSDAILPQFLGDHDTSPFHPSFDLFGGGGLVSNPRDLNRFFRALLGGQIIAPQTLTAALATPAALIADPAPWRTHGYLLASMRIGSTFRHGHTGFWGTGLALVPERDASVIVSLNVAGEASMAAMRHLLEAAVGALAEGDID